MENPENPFKDCLMLKLNGETIEDPTIVYLDDDEENNSCSGDEHENHPISVKIEPDYNEDEDESNQSMVVEPDDQIVASEVAIKDENNSSDESDVDICLKFEPPENPVIVQEIPTEEQFEVIESNEEKNQSDHEDDASASAAAAQDQSFGSTGSNSGSASNEHDHSYSQSNNNERTGFCEEILENILGDSNFKDDPKAIQLLSSFTNYLDLYTHDEDPNSSVSQYIQRMKDTLVGKQEALNGLSKNNKIQEEINEEQPGKFLESPDEEMPLVQPQNDLEKNEQLVPDEIRENQEMQTNVEVSDGQEIQNEEIEKENDIVSDENEKQSDEQVIQKSIAPQPSIELFSETENWDDSIFQKENENVEQEIVKQQDITDTPNIPEIADNQPKSPLLESPVIKNESMDVSYEMIKEEPIENLVIIENQACDDKKVEIKTDEAEKLQTCIKSAADVGNLFTSIQDLQNYVYETDEDIKNGKAKLLTSLHAVIKQSCKLMMEIEDVRESQEIKFDEFIDSTVLNLCNAYTNGSVKKEEKKSDDSGTSGSETDDEEINKLCNINALKISKGNRDVEKDETNPVPARKSPKEKRKKKLFKFSDDSDILSSDEEDTTRPTQNENKSEKESSSDEEQKMIQKHESNVKNMLLGSSDEDDSDESTYATSESSMSDIVSDDEEKPKNKDEEKHESDGEKSEKSVRSTKSTKEIEKPKLEPETPSKESTKESSDESPNEKDTIKPKKPKQRQMDSVTKEIFGKNFLNIESDEDESKTDKILQPKQTNSSTSISTSNSRESTSGRNDNDAIDLSQYTARQSEIKTVDLTKYIEKKITEKVTSPDGPSTTKTPTPIEDDDCFIISSDSDSEVSSTHEKTRRRKELSPEELKEETKKAQKAEKERIKKLEKKYEIMSQYQSQRLSQQSADDDDIICENDLILDYSKKLKKAIEVHPKLVDKLKNHQREGIQFMYDNCYGNVDDVKADNGSGCILAHCMGLGKTLQLITLIHTVTRYPELNTNRILVICPKTTIYNWFEEFQKWLTGIPSRGMKVGFLEENMKIEQKIKKIEDWFETKNPSVFLINYESFRALVNWSGSHKKAKTTLPEDVVKKFQAKITKYLLDPGPQLVVCDEGHMIKNQKGAANRAISKVTTKRRIILTGTPIQNNLAEYYAMVHWIKPCYLGDIKEFNNLYANPIKEGQLKDSTAYQIKKMKQKCFVLNKMLDKFVQRREASILKEFLPEKHEYCLFVPLTEQPQSELYKKFLEENPFEITRGKQLLPDYTALRKVWTHPRVLKYARERALKGGNKFETPKKVRNPMLADEDDDNEVPDDIHDTSQGVTGVTSDWWSSICNDDQLKSLYSSHKLLILFELLKQCHMRGEKCLVFTAFVAVLDVIEQFMKEINDQDNNPKAMLYGYDQYRTTWQLGKDYLRLDGSTPREYRHQMINEFNKTENQRLRCFLISAKAGGQGINLIGANRCVLIDTSWNPSSDQQNIFRIFRLGQKKPCYVYRLLALGTMEEKIYSRSVTKQAMSGRVVDRQIIDRHYRSDELEQLYQFTEYDPRERETPVMPKDDVLKFLLMNYQQQIYKYHEHDSLLENKPEQDLSEAEKKEAWDLYENEQRAQANRLNPMLGVFGNQQPFGGIGMDLNYDIANLMNNPYQPFNFPSTSTGVAGYNFDAMSKSYYPTLPNSIYSNELYKKFYDPMSIYSLPLPPVSTITSSSSNTALPTVSTNSLSSLLRSPLAPPTAPPAAHSLSSIPTTYNANSIALPTKSIFATKPSIPSSISSSPGGTKTTQAIIANKPNAHSLVKQNLKRPNINADQLSQVLKLPQQKRIDPLASLAKGNSAALSILPDGDNVRRPMNGNSSKNQQLNKAKSGSLNSLNNSQLSSARTNAPYVRSTDIRKASSSTSSTVLDQYKKAVTPVNQVVLPKVTMHNLVTRPQINNKSVNKKLPVNTTVASPRGNQEYLKRIQQLQPPRPGNNSQSRPNAPQRPANVQQLNRNAQQQNRNVPPLSGVFKKNSIDPAIQKQLEKNQTSMTEATRPLQISSVVGKNAENSVSIIALKNAATASPVRVTKPTQAEIAITPLAAPPGKKSQVQTISSKVTAANRATGATTSGTKVVISPQYLGQQQGVKRNTVPNASPVPQKKIKIQHPQILRNPNTSQPQAPVTSRINIPQQPQSQQPKRTIPNIAPIEIVEIE